MKLKYIYTIFIYFSFIYSYSQTATEIVDHYLERIGGVHNLQKLQSIKMSAIVKAEEIKIPMEIYSTKKGEQAIIIDLDGNKITQFAFDGETMWTTDVYTGIPEKGLREPTSNIKLSAKDFPTPLLNYKEKGYTLQYVGEEKIDQSTTHKIKLIQSPMSINGEHLPRVLIFYFDKKTLLPVSKSSEIKVDGKEQEINQSFLKDYKKVKNFYFPFTIIEGGQEIKIRKIDLNPEIDVTIFAFPEN